MERIIELGKVAHRGNKKVNPVRVTIELSEDDKPVLSITGAIWNAKDDNIVIGGEILSTIKQYFKDNPLVEELYRLYCLYHRNDKQYGTTKQLKALYEWKKTNPTEDYREEYQYLETIPLYEDIHPVLGKVFYGHHVMYNAIPEEDLNIIKSIIKDNKDSKPIANEDDDE